MRTLAVLLLAAAPAFADDRLVHKSDSGSFKCLFPSPAEQDGKELAVGGDRTVPVWTHRAKNPTDHVFSVTVAEYPPAFAEVPADTVLDGARDGLKGKDGKVKAEERMKGPYPGRAVRIEAGKNTVRTRLILVGSRLYQVTVTGSTKNFPEKMSEAFFASFEPTPR